MSTQTAHDESTTIEVSPMEAYDLMRDCIYAGIVPMLHGAPMASKSSIARELADKESLVHLDVRLSTKDTTDLTGVIQVTPYEVDPETGEAFYQSAYYVPFEDFPLDDWKLPKGKKGWLLCLDEITSISKPMEAAAYQLVLDRAIGMAKLHPKCYVVAMGNDPKHGAVATSQGSAMRTRVFHIFVKQDASQWINWANKNDIDPRIIAFIRNHPECVAEFEYDRNAITFCGSRTLEMLSKLIKGRAIGHNSLPRIAGAIGVPAAHKFIQFETIYKGLEDFDSMMNDPTSDRSDYDITQQFILVQKLISGVNDMVHFNKAMTVLSTFTVPDINIIFTRGVIDRKVIPNILTNPNVRKIVEENRALFIG